MELLNITRTFGPLVALDNVSVRFAPASVHGLLGENGAGKSTLVNIAFGLLRPDTGHIRVASQSAIHNPQSAIRNGLGMVHQHFKLAGALSVLDNVLLGDRRLEQWIDRRQAAQQLARLAESVGLPIDPLARVDSLSVGRQQRVEILKALWRDARILILDEPTAVLSPMEAGQLLEAMARLRDRGCAIVFISHKLREVRQICDRVTILRRGRVVWEGSPTEASDADLAHHMVGGEEGGGQGDKETGNWQQTTGNSPASSGLSTRHSGLLSLRNVSAVGLSDISFDIPPGRILGIAGVDGNGQQELSEIVVGLRSPRVGRVFFDGKDITALPLGRRISLGMAHVPNDRKNEALVAGMSITQNLALKRYNHSSLSKFGLISWRRARGMAEAQLASFDIRAAGPETPVGRLSGGNQQKVVLARELSILNPRLIVAMNPSRGLDVAATDFVYRQLLDRRAAGCAILLISSELDELLALCDRIAVLYAGRLTLTNFPRTTRDEIGRLMTTRQ